MKSARQGQCRQSAYCHLSYCHLYRPSEAMRVLGYRDWGLGTDDLGKGCDGLFRARMALHPFQSQTF